MKYSYKGQPLALTSARQKRTFFTVLLVAVFLSTTAFVLATYSIAQFIGWSWIILVICVIVLTGSVTTAHGGEKSLLPRKITSVLNQSIVPAGLACAGMEYSQHTFLFWAILTLLATSFAWKKYTDKVLAPFKKVTADNN